MQKQPSWDDAFARGMRHQRERLGKSQRWLAGKVTEHGYEWHQSTVYKAEAGSRKVSVGEAAAIADALNVEVQELIYWHTSDQERDSRLLFTAADNFLQSLLQMDEIGITAAEEQDALGRIIRALDEQGFTTGRKQHRATMDATGQIVEQDSQPQTAADYYGALLEVDAHRAYLTNIRETFDDLAFQEISGNVSGIVGLTPHPVEGDEIRG